MTTPASTNAGRRKASTNPSDTPPQLDHVETYNDDIQIIPHQDILRIEK